MTDDETSESSSGRSVGSSDSSDSESDSHASTSSSSSSVSSRSGSSNASRLADIKRADQIFGRNSSITGTMGYARLSSAGKSTVDHLIRKRCTIIGRAGFDADCQIRSDSGLVSRRHARLFWDEDADQWAIECLSHKNGMLVDGTPLVVGAPPLHLRSKNLIEMGDAAFFFLEAAHPTIRTGDIIRTEALVLDLRASRKKKRMAPSAPTSYAQLSRKRRRLAPTAASSYKRTIVHARKKNRSAAADVETDDSSKEDDARTGERRKDEERPLKRRTASAHPSKSARRANIGKSTAEVLEDDDDISASKSIDYPTPRSVSGKRRSGGKQSAVNVTPASKKRKSSAVQSPSHSGNAGAPSIFREEWNKKEKTDFGRALFAIGVNPSQDAEGIITYDWTRFRGIAELSKKSDAMLADYYERMMHDVKTLLEEEEREKRTKGPRTKHKPKCDCVVCENTRKSRRKKREENNIPGNASAAESDGENDDVAVKSTGRTEDRLVGLVTAQKLRVRMSIHEAARQVDSEAGSAVINKLSSQSNTSAAGGDLPEWWITGKHDRALMMGTAKHGVGQWQEIWKDNELEEFADVREEQGEDVTWPTSQTAMKRLREVSSSINAEIRRLTKREERRAAVRAEKEEVSTLKAMKAKGKGKSKSKSKAPVVGKSSESGVGKGKGRGKNSTKNDRKLSVPKHRSAYTYGDGDGAEAQTQSERTESRTSTQEESDLEIGFEGNPTEEQSRQIPNDVDVDDDEVEIEVEEEEEFEVEVEEYAEDVEQPEGKQAMETDDEDEEVDDEEVDEGEDKVEYETASDSGSD